MKHLLKCPKCKTYTTHDMCLKCNVKSINPRPPKYSPKNPYARYRRKAKEKELKSRGML